MSTHVIYDYINVTCFDSKLPNFIYLSDGKYAIIILFCFVYYDIAWLDIVTSLTSLMKTSSEVILFIAQKNKIM